MSFDSVFATHARLGSFISEQVVTGVHTRQSWRCDAIVEDQLNGRITGGQLFV